MKKHCSFPVFRALALVLCVLLSFSAMAAAERADDGLRLVATSFPAYDVARQLGGERAEISMLLPPGGESHSYEPTPQDILRIQNADLFLYVGGESDHWVEGVLASMGERAPRVFRLMDCVAALTEEASESMEPDGHADHGHIEAELDEHVWTSPRNVRAIAVALCDVLSGLAPAYEADFAAARDAYAAALDELDAAFVRVVAGGKRDVLVFGDRFPFRYFAAAYGLRYDAAFPGCSEDSEPSVRTVISLVDKVKREGVPVVFYIEFSSRKTAEILAEETGAKPLLFHSCHNVSAEELQQGATYLSLMWQNVESLKEALN